MKVYCYHQDISGFDVKEMMAIWIDRWLASGFDPEVLGIEHSKKSELYSSLVESTKDLPSDNPPGYDQACWNRWAAFDAVGGGLMVDYDVLPTTLNPLIMGQIHYHAAILHEYRVPCAVKATSMGAKWICYSMISMSYRLRELSHASDMIFFQNTSLLEVIPLVSECNSPTWFASHAVHFSHNSTKKAGWNRLDAMKGHQNLSFGSNRTI